MITCGRKRNVKNKLVSEKRVALEVLSLTTEINLKES
jgi:hypothetical protein